MSATATALSVADIAALPGVTTRALGGRFGLEVNGLKLSDALEPSAIQAIKNTIHQHKVLVFRGQQHLDNAAQEAFAGRLGEVFPHPTVPQVEGTKGILKVDGSESRASAWHSDISFLADFTQYTLLRGDVVPTNGGATAFADAVSAYEELPTPLKLLAENTWALHTNAFDYANVRNENGKYTAEQIKRFREVFARRVWQTEHPLVIVHPVTGQRALLLGSFVNKLIGYGASDSAKLTALFYDHLTSPENTIRWNWTVGDLVIWDDRQTLHRAIDDFGDQARVLYRTTVRGPVPVSVDGKTSIARLVDGDPVHSPVV